MPAADPHAEINSEGAVLNFRVPRQGASYRPIHWSKAVALDPKHRPQVPHRASTTVRREWWRWPQEAHLLDLHGERYRRLSATEIARLQSFDPDWFSVPGLGELDQIRAIGDAVPPLLAQAVMTSLLETVKASDLVSAIEICAGSGGLALGAARLGIEHALLVDNWEVSGAVLAHGKPWQAQAVRIGDATSVDYTEFRGQVGLLSGGPPCQPWSTAGLRQGFSDKRDLLGWVHTAVGQVRPAAFIFENVPGLLSDANRRYLNSIVARLRNPNDRDQYGVALGVLNAADYGVPQRRRRLFFIGLRGLPSSRAFGVFDGIESHATHHDPRSPRRGRLPWRTTATALDHNVSDSEWFEWPYGGGLDR